jgi:predicted RNA-binding Zn-ribbon protein involved in translation (DUF1610 family)
MVVWWGSKSQGQIDAVTFDEDFTCPKCGYVGPLLLRLLKQKTAIFSIIPLTGWRDKGGWMVCPACGNTAKQISKRKYRAMQKFDSGPEFVQALQWANDKVADQFPTTAEPS